ncbi:hypothetical protein K5549_005311 [Capra hircus]|nr:hypothetical protein K5549_005311 [Capra hircus]
MTTHSSILAWKIPRTEEPSRLECTGLHRVGQKTPWVLKMAKFFNYSKNMTKILPCKFLLSYRIILLELEC